MYLLKRATTQTMGDGGFATVLALALIGLLAIVAGAGVAVGQIVLTRQQVGSAADLAAISVASHLAVGDDDSLSCAAAMQSAEVARARVVSCSIDGSDAVVEVSRRPPDWLVGIALAAGSPDGTIHARARAGPPETGG